MSEENVEVVRKAFAYEFYGHGGRTEAAMYFAPDFEMNPVEGGRMEEERSTGLDSIRDNFERWAGAWENLDVTAEKFVDAGDRVLVTMRHRGRGRTSGVEVDARFFVVYTLREGKVSRVDEYTEREEALEAAGLSE
jgi:ketosteroid isomerase-like protein